MSLAPIIVNDSAIGPSTGEFTEKSVIMPAEDLNLGEPVPTGQPDGKKTMQVAVFSTA